MSQPLLVDEPLQRINPADALVISIGIVIQSQDQLGIMVMDALQGAQLSFECFLIANSGGNLYVVRPLLIDSDEVHLKLVHLADGYVGPKTTKKLIDYGILTIGDLANAPRGLLKYKLGKNGLMLQDYANGLDRAPVKPTTLEESIGSVGNSITPPHDIKTVEDARCIYYLLSESVGARMRDAHLQGQCVSISVRTTELMSYSCQRKLSYATNVTSEIASIACQLFEERFTSTLPLRSVGVSVSALSMEGAPVQMDLFGQQQQREKRHQLDCALDAIRQRYGNLSVVRGIVLAEPNIAKVDPKDDHTIHPVPFFSG